MQQRHHPIPPPITPGDLVTIGDMHVRPWDRRYIARDRLTGRHGTVLRVLHVMPADPEPMVYVRTRSEAGQRADWLWASEVEVIR